MLFTGIIKFDDQHGTLVKLLDQLIVAAENPSLAEVTVALFSELVEAATQHFADEEAFMTEHDLPILPDHQKDHQEFLSKALELQRMAVLTDQQVPVDMVTFLRNWFIDHIVDEDTKYSPASI